MSENNTTNNNPVQPPVYFMPPQQPMIQNDIFNGLSGIICSVLAGLILGQLGIGFPRLPKL